MNKLDFAGRNAIVTGGAQGIGLAIVQRLLASGARVRIWDRDSKLLGETVAKLGSSASGEAIDVTDPAATERGAAAALKAFGSIDVLVNNAGIAGMAKPVIEYPVDEWKRVIDIDLTGPFLCCRAVAPHMIKSGYGRIVNIASVAGKEGNPNAAAYGAAKGGLITFTKSLGKELAQTGVLVNCVTPAAAKTAIFDQVTEEFTKYMLSKIPMGRFVKVEEIAALACWLASEDCSFTTGGVFDISGGRATY
jgi:2-dehydro-3-deoxy-L-rhamnonate dehydrogenase (NAD+)